MTRMGEPIKQLQKRTILIAIIDIGTHAARLAIARLNFNEKNILKSYRIILQRRLVSRLGEKSFRKNLLTSQAVQRTIKICNTFIREAKRANVSHIFAFATSAIREAANKKIVLEQFFNSTGIQIKVLSGNEEANAIFYALKDDIPKRYRQNALCIEIGGGSTELAVADYKKIESPFAVELKIGALKLTELFVGEKIKDAIPLYQYEGMKRYVIRKWSKTLTKIKRYKPHLAIGSSGTIRNLCAIAGIKKTLSLQTIKRITRQIISKNLKERMLIAGIEADRADILPAGAAILEGIMEELNIKKILLSSRSLRDGLVYEVIKTLSNRNA